MIKQRKQNELSRATPATQTSYKYFHNKDSIR